MNDIVNVILNGKPVKAYKGESVLELSRRMGVEIPTLCNDDRLEPYTSCYLCVVEIEKMKGLQPSCSTKVNEGMCIETDNEKIHKARKTALELLLSNHYADCIAPCKLTCPAGVDVQGYISYIEKGMYSEAVALIKETNPLPAVCGRVCVRPCELACRRNLLDEGHGVGIDYLKRFASDIDLNSPNKWKPKIKASTGKKIAIIGSGPAGLSAAFFLQKEGHQSDIFEAAPKAGGWLRYGIPEYRLPNDILQKEVDNITELGAKVFFNKKLGDNLSFKELKSNYDAVLLAVGSQQGTSIGCEGDDNPNVFSGIDFLKKMELSGKRFNFKGKTVAVIGGGNTAMDCCRTAVRCGASKVYVVYRRTENEMPANPIEIHESKLEGVEYMFLTAPVKVNADKNGDIDTLTCLKMELGEADASGRRRPVPVEGSEFNIKLDFILAAIGQKSIADFVDDVNIINSDNGQLMLTKWGFIDANKETLQTNAKNIFVAGDGFTGPATIIQAIAQARIATNSINLYLQGKEVVPLKKEFLSKKENFKVLTKEDFTDKYEHQLRHEMPVIPTEKRNNFDEVELGYENEDVAKKETQRCLECGCNEVFTCDLKKYSTEYNAVQTNYSGEFVEYQVDFRHPFIEIDNNKCILCARCIRICNEVVGASALGLVNRGFKSYVAPAMGESLLHTNCESCGLCISTCPTGAITENFYFKPGPVKLDKAYTICNYCSLGCKIELNNRNAFVMRVNGAKGLVNTDSNICRLAKFAYHFYNDKNRITKPLLKKDGKFIEITFDEAINIISERIKSVLPDENIFYAGARLTNEELYLVQKLARYAVKTNNITSFHYLNRNENYFNSHIKNVPLENIEGASKFYLLGSNISKDNAVAGFKIFNLNKTKNIAIDIITNNDDYQDIKKATNVLKIKDYYYFIKAVNHYLLANRLENKIFINDNCSGFDEYNKNLLSEDFNLLVDKCSASKDVIINFANDFNNQINAVLVVSEKEVSSATINEIVNLALITGKYGKTSMGIIVMKENTNSYGLTDMGINPKFGVGAVEINDNSYIEKIKNIWGVDKLPAQVDNISNFKNSAYKNIFIFGEDPVGCAKDKSQVDEYFANNAFTMVQEYFMTETALKANLILPASLPVEIGGSFTNSQHIIQNFDAENSFNNGPDVNSLSQIIKIINNTNASNKTTDKPTEILDEAFSLLSEQRNENYKFHYTVNDYGSALFNYGCDNLYKIAEDYFKSKLNK
jgi:formate dehydrogenase major subunit